MVAIADCKAGVVWKLNTNTGEHTMMLKDETMAANTEMGVLLGINGLQVLSRGSDSSKRTDIQTTM